MLLSNLGLPKNIQLTTRFLGLLITWLILGLVSKKSDKKIHFNFAMIFLLFNIFFYFISTVYSVSSLKTFLKCFEIFTDFCLMYAIYQKDEKDFVVNTFNVTVFTIFIEVLITVLGFILIPQYFTDGGYSIENSLFGTRLSQGFLGANQTSALAVLCLFWLFFSNRKNNFLNLFMFFVCIFAMFFSQSRTTLLLVPIIILLRFFKPNSKYKFFYFIIVALLVGICFVNFDKIKLYVLRGQTEEMLKSGTGRTTMWSVAKTYVEKKPIFGYGYGVGGELVSEEYFGMSSMHSAKYEILLGTGYFGYYLLIFEFIIVVFLICRNILKYRFKNNLLDIMLLLFFIVRSYSSSGIAGWHGPEIMLWYFLLFSVSVSAETIQMKNNKFFLN